MLFGGFWQFLTGLRRKAAWALLRLQKLLTEILYPHSLFSVSSFLRIYDGSHWFNIYRLICDSCGDFFNGPRWAHYIVYDALDKWLQSGQQNAIDFFLMGRDAFAQQPSHPFLYIELLTA